MLSRISVYGSLGVDVFFVLSGFLITSLLIQARTRPGYYQDFYWKRALRILPLYFVFLLITLLVFKHSAVFVLFSALFLANISTIFHVQNFGSPFWSLAVEEQFYLLWPTVVRRLKVKQLGYFAIAIWVGCIVARFSLAMKGHHNYYLTYMRCDGLALGALMASLSSAKKDRSRFYFCLLGAALVLLGAAAALPGAMPGYIYREACIQTAAPLAFGGLMGLSILCSGSRATAILRGRVLSFFGLISYALYLIHTFVSLAYDKRWPLTVGDTGAYILRFVVIAVVTLALCLVSRYVIELPALSLRRFVLKTPAPLAETEMPLAG